MIAKVPSGLFQSTLPVWGATRDTTTPTMQEVLFQSTLPVWGATARPGAKASSETISIHAPRVGSDVSISSL